MVTTTGSASAPGRTVDVNGIELYYEEHGTGDPLVLIHGGLGTSAMLQPLVSHLVDDFRVITPDSRGHGRSTNPAGILNYPLLADDMAAMIHALELEKPVVGGWSDGGQVALELGARHPEIAGGLIVGAAFPDFRTTGLWEINRRQLAIDGDGKPDVAGVERTLGEFAGLVKSWHVGGDQQWHQLVHQTAPMWLDYPGLTLDDLKKITTLTLVLIGDRDEEFTLDLMVQLFRNLPNAELAVCPQGDHLGPLLPERAGIFASMIRDFVNRCLRGESRKLQEA